MFSVASLTCATAGAVGRALQASKPWHLQPQCSACEGRMQVRSGKPQRHHMMAGMGAGASQREPNEAAMRAGKARAVAEPSVVASVADEPAGLQPRGPCEEETATVMQNGEGEWRGHELEAIEAGSLDREDEASEGGEGSEDAVGENGAISAAALQREVARRRNFAIISHPDAGKTTLVLHA